MCGSEEIRHVLAVGEPEQLQEDMQGKHQAAKPRTYGA